MKDDDKHESPENTKKPYTPPVLTDYGDILKTTQILPSDDPALLNNGRIQLPFLGWVPYQ